MKNRQTLLTACVIAATLALPSMATAQCNPNGLGVHYLDLKLPFDISPSSFGNPAEDATMLLEGPTPNPDPECQGWFSALVKISIPEGCSRAHIWLEYEGMPTGWTVNIGDTLTNNGFGGDQGEPDSEAELQVLDETLSVYSVATSPGVVDLLAQEDMGLTDGALQICVGDQFVSWGQPFTALETPSSELLFKLPDPASAEPNTVYLGVNRVVAGTNRRGCGVRRVLISFS